MFLSFQLSWIRGYAANNSRALQRRRSSTTEYVQPMVLSSSRVTDDGANSRGNKNCQENGDQCHSDITENNNIKTIKFTASPYFDMQCGSQYNGLT